MAPPCPRLAQALAACTLVPLTVTVLPAILTVLLVMPTVLRPLPTVAHTLATHLMRTHATALPLLLAITAALHTTHTRATLRHQAPVRTHLARPAATLALPACRRVAMSVSTLRLAAVTWVATVAVMTAAGKTGVVAAVITVVASSLRALVTIINAVTAVAAAIATTATTHAATVAIGASVVVLYGMEELHVDDVCHFVCSRGGRGDRGDGGRGDRDGHSSLLAELKAMVGKVRPLCSHHRNIGHECHVACSSSNLVAGR